MAEKTSLGRRIITWVVVLAAIGWVTQLFTGDMGSGVKEPEYDGHTATIKIDNYSYVDGTSIGLKNLAKAMVMAADREETEEIYLEITVEYTDSYGNESTKVHRGRVDDTDSWSISELRKYRTGEDLYESTGIGLGLVYEAIKMNDSNVVASSS